uniref:Membrane protein-like protein n=1 Tax=Polynucleobacter necessarius subsp. necessarius (strain STIR1) TaxID=452638 RepID=B1XVM2_POLNS
MIWLGLAAAIFVGALIASPPRIFKNPPLIWLAPATILFLAIAWNISPSLPGQPTGRFYGLIFHFYGASLLTAMFGPAIALSILFPVAFLGVYAIQGNYEAAFQHYLMMCVLPTLFAYLSIQIIQRFIPKHLFVLILGNGYVAAFMSVILSGTFLLVVKLIVGESNQLDLEGWLLGLIIIAFMEGSLSGMLLAILLIFRPQWVSTYDEATYMSQ